MKPPLQKGKYNIAVEVNKVPQNILAVCKPRQKNQDSETILSEKCLQTDFVTEGTDPYS